jgi:hypothetical protein
MPCNQDCQQGRRCDCSLNTTADRAVVVICSLLLIAVLSMGYGVYKLLHITKGEECAITVKFKDSSATYIGRSV